MKKKSLSQQVLCHPQIMKIQVIPWLFFVTMRITEYTCFLTLQNILLHVLMLH